MTGDTIVYDGDGLEGKYYLTILATTEVIYEIEVKVYREDKKTGKGVAADHEIFYGVVKEGILEYNAPETYYFTKKGDSKGVNVYLFFDRYDKDT